MWLIFLELTLINLAWYFDVKFQTNGLQVLWALGVSMLTLAVFIHMPKRIMLLSCFAIVFGHNFLDYLVIEDNLLWSLLHETKSYQFTSGFQFFIDYPIIPWIGVMPLGFLLGEFYSKTFKQEHRRKYFNWIGFVSIGLFLIIRLIDGYGNSVHWEVYDSFSQTLIVFLNPNKYPPSLAYLLMTLGPCFLFLANSEKLKGRIVNVFTLFGRVPFFYYIIHLYLIHFLACLAAEMTGFGWDSMLLYRWIINVPELKGYGFSLSNTYLIWISIIVILYPVCIWFDKFKQKNKDKVWLSYL